MFYTIVVGIGKKYFNLIRKTCEEYDKILKIVGYKNLGDIERISCIIQEIEKGNT
jgi:hypothetical protein